VAASACDPQRNLLLAGIPGVGTEFRVVGATERYGFLDAQLEGVGHDTRQRSFLPATASCRRVVSGERVRFVSSGAAGTLVRDGERCDAVGIGTLTEWRARRPEPAGLGGTPVPRAQATFHQVYADEETLLLRGDFPLSSRVGWSGFADTIAVVPNVPRCRPVAARGVASLEYHPSGEPVLGLVTDEGPCPIHGLIQPGRPVARTR
jgi:hypothetical protein